MTVAGLNVAVSGSPQNIQYLAYLYGTAAAVAGPPHGPVNGYIPITDPSLLVMPTGELIGSSPIAAPINADHLIFDGHPLRQRRVQCSALSWKFIARTNTTSIVPLTTAFSSTYQPTILVIMSALSPVDFEASWLAVAPRIINTTIIIDKTWGSLSDASAGHAGTCEDIWRAVLQIDPSATIIIYARQFYNQIATSWYSTAANDKTASATQKYQAIITGVGTNVSAAGHDWTHYEQAVSNGLAHANHTQPLGHYLYAFMSGLTIDAAAWTAFAPENFDVYGVLTIQGSTDQLQRK